MQPVIIDLETRSACDLPREGGYRYAVHPTTRLLTVSWSVYGSNVFHLWFPGLRSIPDDMAAMHLPGVILHFDRDEVPADLSALRNRTWVGHNAFGFDSLVWRECTECEPAEWVDSLNMACACGMPGGLNRIGQWLWGEGKYEAGAKEAKKAFTAKDLTDCEPENVPILRQVLTGKYNVQDVKLTCELWRRLTDEHHTTEAETSLLAAHRAINDRGVRVDFDLLHAMHKLAIECKAAAVEDIAKLTDNALPDEKAIQSRTRVLAWLTKMGVWEGTSLRKEIVTRFIDENEEPDESEEVEECKDIQLVVKVLKLRLSALRITGGKLDAAAHRLSGDRRIRGLFGYWRAHTGRFTSTGVQLHNLPRPKPGIKTWKLIELFERTGRLDFADVKALLPTGDKQYARLTPDDAASALLKSLFLPDEGCMLAAADLSQIEARMLAWLAGEKWLMDLFWTDGDPYVRMATRILGPVETWPDYNCSVSKHPYRQIVGKIPELACIAEGTPVLTDSGWKPIEKILSGDRLWNGEKFVLHGGVIFSGVKPCLNVSGVWMTADHAVWTGRSWATADQIDENTLYPCPGTYSRSGQFSPFSLPPVADLSGSLRSVAAVTSVTRLSTTLSRVCRRDAIRARDRKLSTQRRNTTHYAPTLSIANDYVPGSPRLSADARGRRIGSGLITAAGASPYARNGLTTGHYSSHICLRCRDGITKPSRLTELRIAEDMNPATYDSPLAVSRTRTVVLMNTYDILNVQERSAFQAGPLVVHNCGYQMGARKLEMYCAGMGYDLKDYGTTAEKCIIEYRRGHAAIAGEEREYDGHPYFRGGFWDQLNDAAIMAVQTGHLTYAGRIQFYMSRGCLHMVLPSGRRMVYRNATIVETTPFAKPIQQVQFLHPRYGLKRMYPGAWAENAVQAASRDVMGCGIIRSEAAKMPVAFHVHDEIGASTQEERFGDFMSCVTTPADWLPDFPLVAEGGMSPRYSKDSFPGWNNGKEQVYRNGARHK